MNNTKSENNKYRVNDHIMYLNNGICRIDDIRDETFGGMEPREYYVMHALNDPRSVIFVPTDSEKLTSGMLNILSPEEITEIIELAENDDIQWISDTKLRSAHYMELLETGDRVEILKLLKSLSLHKTEVEKQKKKFYASDERILAAATKFITEEFAFVLGIGQNEVIPYIIDRTGTDG